jgi:prepilin-type processing-associated H-X9-DG protein
MYADTDKDIAMDAYRFMDYLAGVPSYFNTDAVPEKIARCPDDRVTESLGRLGTLGAHTNPVYEIRGADGNPYTVRASIGANQNILSASARPTGPSTQAFWVKTVETRGQPNKMMVWCDWQNNPVVETPTSAIVKLETTGMGSIPFRHDGVANAAFQDGHVGTMRCSQGTTNKGHDLAAANWQVPAEMMPIPQIHKLYYPFGPGQTPTGWQIRGDWAGIELGV